VESRHWGHQWPIVPAPGDYDDGEIGGMIGRGNRSTRKKTCPSAALSTTNPTCCPDANPGRRGGKPASNRLSYGTALYSCCSHLKHRTSMKRFFSLQFLDLRQSLGSLGWELSPSQGRYLHTNRIIAENLPCRESDSNPRSQCSSEWRQLMP
jgi:hypothetical protein